MLGLDQRKTRLLLLVLFFFSGFAGLMYELVWIRILSVVFGKTTLALTVVVSVYMAGLGLGSRYWGKRIDQTKNSMKTFSFLEMGIGIASLVVLLLFSILPGLYKLLFTAFGAHTLLLTVAITLTSFLFMLVPTFLMGGTLPVLSTYFVTDDRSVGGGVGMLYAVNTLGSILGVGITGFFLIGSLGQTATQLIAIGINLSIGVIALKLRPINENKSEQKAKTTTGEGTSESFAISPKLIQATLLIAGLTGFCGMAYEILATRVLSVFIVNSTYSFTSILIVFLLGISIGSFIFIRFFKDSPNLTLILVSVLAIIGVYNIVVVGYLNDIPLVLNPLKSNLLRIPLFDIIMPGLLLATILLLVPATCLGIIFPALCKIYSVGIATLGQRVGSVYFYNTLGSIVGPMVAAFIMIPLFGVAKSMILISCIPLFMGIGLLFALKPIKQKQWILGVSLVLVLVSTPFVVRGVKHAKIHPPTIFRTSSYDDAILYYKETQEGTILVREDKRSNIRSLYVNNNIVCGIVYDAVKVVKMLGHLPFLVNRDIKDILIIGFGVGITTSEVARHDIKKIDCVEIAPGVREAAKYFSSQNRNIAYNPKVKFIDGDGRNHLLVTQQKYDLISCDPTHPTLGCGNLYTEEYFRLCKKHLTKRGVVSQYLPLHRLSLDQFKSLIKTFHSVFPNTTVWLGHTHCVLLGTPEPFSVRFDAMRSYLYSLKDDFLYDPYALTTTLLLNSKAIKEFTKDVPIHYDDRPFLEFFTPSSVKVENWHLNLEATIKQRINPVDHVLYIDNMKKMGRYIQGQYFFLQGLIEKNKSHTTRADFKRVMSFFKRAHEMNPENREIKLFLDDELKRYMQAGGR